MLNLFNVIERIQSICQERNLSVNKVLQDSGAGKDLIANMRKGQVLTIAKFLNLAEYLGVSIDYLINRTDNPYINK